MFVSLISVYKICKYMFKLPVVLPRSILHHFVDMTMKFC